MKKSTNVSVQARRLSTINMEMMKCKRDVKLAWRDTENVIRFHQGFSKSAKKIKIPRPESTLYAATCPFFYIARIFGLAPYKFDDNQLLVPSDIKIIYSIICTCLYTYIIYDILLDFPYSSSTDGLTLRITQFAKVVLNFTVVMFDLLLCLITRNQIATIWNGLQYYDEFVRNLGFTRKERETRIWVWSTLISGAIIFTMINQTGMYAFCQSWVDNVFYLLVYIASAVSVIKFSGIVMLMAQRFNHLNEIVRKCILIQSRWVVGVPSVDLRIVEHLYNHLMILGENLNTVHTWSLMLWLSNLYFHNVTNLFFIISWILETDFNLDLMTCLLCWELSFLGQLLLLSYACHHASSKANCISYIILGWKQQLFMRNRSMEIDTSFHLINRQFHFTAAGCFNVDLPLLRSIASILTTYLAILLQFK